VTQVDYEYDFPYFVPGDGGPAFPGLLANVSRLDNPEESVDVEAHIDTGAEFSVFGGWIATSIGLVLFEGEPINLAPTAGSVVPARLHNVRIKHDILGALELRVAFALDDIRRNLLGRDFLNLVQIGFRERHLAIYVTPTP
jgi:hypothetical protein